jgi:anhydro-N-acetylmuramic acid kinase
MSGTSVDGIDVACADLELVRDELLCRFGGFASTPFDVRLQERIVSALPPGLPGAGELCRLHAELGHAYAAAFAAAREDLAEGEADLAVMHGQTFYHWVDADGRGRGTLQLGNSSAVAERLGVPVISDLRSRDVAAGGQGAPLVSMFDALLLARRTGPGAAVNLGGIANLTVVDGGEVVTAYDLGPAGALMDPAAMLASGGALRFDEDGIIASRGQVCGQLLSRLKADGYYRLPVPRSTGREHFNAGYLAQMVTGLEPAPLGDDIVATVTRLLVDLLAEASREHRLAELILSGGGSKNVTTVAWLRSELPDLAVRTTDELGVPVQAKEALAFAVLGYLTWNGRPGSVTAATGARHPSILGSFEPGAGPLLLPPPLDSSPSRLRIVGGPPRQ